MHEDGHDTLDGYRAIGSAAGVLAGQNLGQASPTGRKERLDIAAMVQGFVFIFARSDDMARACNSYLHFSAGAYRNRQ